MKSPTNDEDRLRFVIDAIEASILSCTDEDIIEDVCHGGQDLDEIAEMMRGLVGAQVKAARQTALRAAQEGYRRASIGKQKGSKIPLDPKERRSLLSRLINVNSGFATELTLAFRDGKSISDEDVSSMLEDLLELGLPEDGNDQ
jgi:hypothetical protein